jgi:hypothetical protein
MLMDNTDVLLHTVSTFVDGDSFDLPTTCSCGGKIQHRGPHLLICHRCRKLMTKIDLLSGVVNKIAEQFILRYPQTPANEIHGNLTAAIVAHERSMAEVNARHQQLLAGRDLAPQLPHGVLIESAKAHGLGLSPDHGIEIPIIYSGRLVATDTVKEGGEIIWGDPSGVQALVGDQVNEVVVAPRGAVPIILHDVVNISALGLYPQATESVLPGKLFAPFKTVIFTPMFDDERLLSIACSVLKMKADARLITTNAEACNWSSNRAVRSAIKNSVDLVLHMIDNLSEVGDYGHEQMRHELEQLIVATPAGARRNRYMARLAKATGRRKRDVESDLEGVSRSVADASAADIIEDPIKAVVAMGNAISKMAVVDAGDVDVPALVEAVAKCCKSEPCVPHHSHTYVAKGFTKKIAQEMDRRRLDPRKLGAELVRVGLLGSSKEDRPKLYLRSEGKSNACWRIDPVRVKDVADRFGVRIDSLDRDDGENQCG